MTDLQPPTKKRSDRWLWGVLLLVLGIWFAMLARPGSGGAADIMPWRGDLELARQEAGRSERLLLVNFTADWCPPCQQMKADVYSDADFAAWAGEAFVPVKIDMTRPGPAEMSLAGEYGVPGFPTLLVMTPEGEAIASAPGFIGKVELRQSLQRLLDARADSTVAMRDGGDAGVEE